MSNAWDHAAGMADKHASSGGIFIRLTGDGDKVIGAFCGEPFPRSARSAEVGRGGRAPAPGWPGGSRSPAGVAAEHLDGATPTEERDAILARLETGETRVVANCGVLCEGWDQPAVKCAILARPTRSTGLYLQQAGRILRPWNGQRAIILDHGGCVLEHGLPQDDRNFSLQGTKKKRNGKVSAPVRTCPSCFAVLPLCTRVCPECDTVLIEQAEVPTEREGTLVEVHPDDLKRIELERLRSIADERGYKPGWVYYRFKEKFGEAPPRERRRRTPPAVDSRALRDVLRNAARSSGGLDWSSIAAAAQGRADTT